MEACYVIDDVHVLRKVQLQQRTHGTQGTRYAKLCMTREGRGSPGAFLHDDYIAPPHPLS